MDKAKFVFFFFTGIKQNNEFIVFSITNTFPQLPLRYHALYSILIKTLYPLHIPRRFLKCLQFVH